MPWQPRAMMDIKQEFISLASKPEANRRELCRRFGISPTTGYALLARHAQQGAAALQLRSRRPHNSPNRTEAQMEHAVLAVRQANPCWGGRKIARRLRDLGWSDAPAPSTVTAILHRHGQVSAAASLAAQPWQRFEHDTPNALWQIDFKGDFDASQTRCYPLTLLDDHSRYSLALQACTSTAAQVVQPHLIQAFKRYGLPVRINADNGPPWGSTRQAEHGLTPLTVWLIRLGIRISHSAPYHPQTNGKIERFHRSLKTELLAGRSFTDLPQAQAAFERWRSTYNHQRPHDALGLDTPARRYSISPRLYPDKLPEIEYPGEDAVIVGLWNSQARFQGRLLKVPKALHRLPIAVRADPSADGCFELYFCHHRFMRMDLRTLPTAP
jgi:transposase InsO family protein